MHQPPPSPIPTATSNASFARTTRNRPMLLCTQLCRIQAHLEHSRRYHAPPAPPSQLTSQPSPMPPPHTFTAIQSALSVAAGLPSRLGRRRSFERGRLSTSAWFDCHAEPQAITVVSTPRDQPHRGGVAQTCGVTSRVSDGQRSAAWVACLPPALEACASAGRCWSEQRSVSRRPLCEPHSEHAASAWSGRDPLLAPLPRVTCAPGRVTSRHAVVSSELAAVWRQLIIAWSRLPVQLDRSGRRSSRRSRSVRGKRALVALGRCDPSMCRVLWVSQRGVAVKGGSRPGGVAVRGRTLGRFEMVKERAYQWRVQLIEFQPDGSCRCAGGEVSSSLIVSR